MRLTAPRRAPLKRPGLSYRSAAVPENVSESALAAREAAKVQKAKQRQSLRRYVSKAVQILLTVGCAYLIFLIYGMANTDYEYNPRGEIVPVILTVDEIRSIEDFTVMQTQYLQARRLYEQTLVLDVRLGLGEEDPLLIAPEYEALLEGVSSLSVQMGALTVPAAYAQPMDMLLSWVQNDIALYCQFISKAITQNSVQDMNNALTEKELMYENFQQITQVVSTLGSSIPHTDISDILGWSPESYMAQYTGEGI